ncbi:MAG: N-acyl homoserine lactonase family protein [Anaerolineae bacterium]|nr:N-acyl homoserine lactonase family protein [Anaerolineae bacterium]
MSYTIYPMNLGDIEIDYSFLVWGTNQGTKTWVPTTSYLILGADKPIFVDASFRNVDELSASSGLVSRRTADHSLEAQLGRHGLRPDDIGYLIHTHCHLDHTGLDDHFPNAKILVQREDLRYAGAPLFPESFYDRVDIAKIVGPLWSQVQQLDGDTELFPGIRTVVVGGHAPGMQMIYVDLPSGQAIITGDAAYLADMNVGLQVPMGYYYSLPDVMRALARIKRDATYVLPIHDASIMEKYGQGLE